MVTVPRRHKERIQSSGHEGRNHRRRRPRLGRRGGKFSQAVKVGKETDNLSYTVRALRWSGRSVSAMDGVPRAGTGRSPVRANNGNAESMGGEVLIVFGFKDSVLVPVDSEISWLSGESK